jgi:hypothetical protein
MYFRKNTPNLTTLYEDLYKYCIGEHSVFPEKMSIFGRETQFWLERAIENFDYIVYQPTKKGGYDKTYPFFEFWLNRVCDTFELALWHAYHSEGGKGAEKRADEAVEKFRKKFA